MEKMGQWRREAMGTRSRVPEMPRPSRRVLSGVPDMRARYVTCPPLPQLLVPGPSRRVLWHPHYVSYTGDSPSFASEYSQAPVDKVPQFTTLILRG